MTFHIARRRTDSVIIVNPLIKRLRLPQLFAAEGNQGGDFMPFWFQPLRLSSARAAFVSARSRRRSMDNSSTGTTAGFVRVFVCVCVSVCARVFVTVGEQMQKA